MNVESKFALHGIFFRRATHCLKTHDKETDIIARRDASGSSPLLDPSPLGIRQEPGRST